MNKEKLTFVYNNGSTYTTKRNVTDYIVSNHFNEFIYTIEGVKQGSIKYDTTYRIPRNELIAVIVHGNDKFGTPSLVYKMNKAAGVSIQITHPWKDHENPGTMYHVI